MFMRSTFTFWQRRQLHAISNIKVGDSVALSRRFSKDDVTAFAELTGDFNPIHTDADFALQTGLFQGSVVHGALINGFVSGILGTKLPGPGTVAFSQEMRFPNPLYIDEMMEAKITIAAVKKKFVECAIRCIAVERDGSSTATVLLGKAVVRAG